MNEQFVKRLKSFAWRVGMFGLVAVVDAMLANLEVLELNNLEFILLSLALGEVSKYLNAKK